MAACAASSQALAGPTPSPLEQYHAQFAFFKQCYDECVKNASDHFPTNFVREHQQGMDESICLFQLAPLHTVDIQAMLDAKMPSGHNELVVLHHYVPYTLYDYLPNDVISVLDAESSPPREYYVYARVVIDRRAPPGLVSQTRSIYDREAPRAPQLLVSTATLSILNPGSLNPVTEIALPGTTAGEHVHHLSEVARALTRCYRRDLIDTPPL